MPTVLDISIPSPEEATRLRCLFCDAPAVVRITVRLVDPAGIHYVDACDPHKNQYLARVEACRRSGYKRWSDLPAKFPTT